MFDERQMRTLRALLDTVIPPDDYPGAWQAGVGDYLMRQLRGDLAASLLSYRSFLDGLDAEAQAVHRRFFADLGADERTALLKRIEEDKLSADWSMAPAAFFRQVVEHCAEGFYSDPGNGGNRDGVAWDMIGFEARA